MQKIAIYGKGGIGKSMVATALSASFAQRGLSVLHIGCDPKHDSSVRLVDEGNDPPTVLDVLKGRTSNVRREEFVVRARLGIDVAESGGPTPGLGCAGRGVARTLEYFEEVELFDEDAYDIVVFDVLGDVVCGGFAAPLREGFAEKVYIVTSEEPMALYAANNISKAVVNYAPNGVVLGGIIANLKQNEADREILDLFAELIGTRVVAYVPRDQRIIAAEKRRLTIVEDVPDCEASNVLRALADDILALDRATVGLPTPLDDAAFFRFAKEL